MTCRSRCDFKEVHEEEFTIYNNNRNWSVRQYTGKIVFGKDLSLACYVSGDGVNNIRGTVDMYISNDRIIKFCEPDDTLKILQSWNHHVRTYSNQGLIPVHTTLDDVTKLEGCYKIVFEVQRIA